MNPPVGDGSGDGDVERRGAGRGRGGGPWKSKTQEHSALRRPHSTASPGTQTSESSKTKFTKNPVKQEESKLNVSKEEIVQNSKLSVHAAEFIPKSYPVKQPVQQHASMKSPSLDERLQLARKLPLQAEMQQTQNSACNYDTSQHYHQGEQIEQFDNFSQQQQIEQSIGAQDYGNLDGGSGDYKDKHQESSEDETNYLIELTNVTQNLLSVIHSLILNPGRFTSIVPSLINNLRPCLEFPSRFEKILKIIIQQACSVIEEENNGTLHPCPIAFYKFSEIFKENGKFNQVCNQSITEDNFRYSGARLCTVLDTTTTPVEQMSFRDILYNLCKKETERQSSSWEQKDDHTEEEQKRCHGLILFLAELVTQMEHTSAFGLGDLLIQLIIVVLKKPALHSVKNICQALKLAGQTLEKVEGGSRREMENMMRSLTELVTTGRVDSHIGRMVHSVHELRNGNWGQTSSLPAVELPESMDPNQAVDEPVFYGPDGKVLTAEENKFLEDIADSTTNIKNHPMFEHGYEMYEHGYEDEKWSSEDDDIDAAYEEFLRDIPKQIKNQAQK